MIPVQILQFIFGIVALVIIHEFGHYLAAKAFGVEVEEFGFGFPPRILTMFKFKGTDFTLNWIPFGGFVRPKGENDPSVEGGLAAASPMVRFGVLFAGPLMNLLVALALGTILFLQMGEPIPDKVIVSDVVSGTPAESAGLKPGDLFITVAGEPVTSTQELQNLIQENLDKEIPIQVERDGQIVTLTTTPRSEYPEGQGPMGIIISNQSRPINLFQAIKRSAISMYEYVKALALLPIRFIQGSTAPGEARMLGYMGMYNLFVYIGNALYFFMIISVSLGVINLLPFPALDGGRIMMLIPEVIFKKRVPQNYENMINMIGFAILLALLVYINVQDILNPIKLP